VTKKDAASKEAEALTFVRKAMSHVSEKPVSERVMKTAAKKVVKALPEIRGVDA